jgi:acetyltransferase-like isoleucine patch superfamily enzyme
MLQTVKNRYWAYWLAKYDCKLATKVCNLGSATILQMEEHVKLGPIEIHNGHYSFGAYSYMRSGGELYGNTSIGRFCSIGQNVVIGLEKNKHPTTWLSTSLFSKGIEKNYQSVASNHKTTIGNDCWIGRDAAIMTGVTIGDGAIIGARALVTTDVPPYAIYAGVPAKLIRYRFSFDLIDKLCRSKWWNISMVHLSDLKVDEPELCMEKLKNLDHLAMANYVNISITKNGATLTLNRVKF